MAAERNFAALAGITGRARTDFKRSVVKPCLDEFGSHGWNVTEIAGVLAALLPLLEPEEGAEVLAAILAKASYYPFRDGARPSDVGKDGFILDAKSVRYRFSYKNHAEAAARQAAAYRATGFLPGLIIVYQGRTKRHRVVFLPGLLRPNVSVTLNRVVDRPELWTWNKAKPAGILVSQDGSNLTEFLSDPAHVSVALVNMETAMATAAKAFKNDPQMRKDLDEISQETMAAVLKTDIGQEIIARERAEAVRDMMHTDIGQEIIARERAEAAHEMQLRIFRELRQSMPEAEARRITGYTGS